MSTNEAFILVTKRFIAWALLNLSNKALVTYNALLFFNNPTTNTAWPTMETLIHYTGYSRSTLSGSIKELIDKKLITKGTHTNEGKFTNNVYKLITIVKGKVLEPQGLGEEEARRFIKELYASKDFNG